MQRIAVGVEADDLQPAPGKGLDERPSRLRAGFHPLQVEMRRGRPAAGIDLDSVDAELHGLVEKLLEGTVAEAVGNEAKLHAGALSLRRRGAAYRSCRPGPCG